MISINNKFELGQEVFTITKVYQSKKSKKKIWIVREEKTTINCIYYKHKFKGDDDLLYNIAPYGKVREENIFIDYNSAIEECKSRNLLEEEQQRTLSFKKKIVWK